MMNLRTVLISMANYSDKRDRKGEETSPFLSKRRKETEKKKKKKTIIKKIKLYYYTPLFLNLILFDNIAMYSFNIII